MGICGNLGPRFAAVADGANKDTDIQQGLFIDELKALYQFKVLVLGAGESGKSTVVKQLRFIHKSNKLTERELKRVKETLAENTFDCFRAMVEACNNFGIELDDDDDKKTAAVILDDSEKTSISPEMAVALVKLWNSNAIKKVYEMREKYWILDAVEYFMENITRFAEPDFQPLEEDVVMARVRTTGIVTTEFTQRNPDGKEEWDKEIHYQVIDVGGQRAERKKWFHCFDDVKAILFVINMAGYNMVLFEEDTKNRMAEEIELFRETVRKDIFRRTPIFVFLNKKDLFEEKLRKVDLKSCFPDYEDGPVTAKALEFISKKFRDQMPPENLDQYRDFYIASRVKRDVKYAFEDLQADLLKFYKKKLETETKRILQEAKFSKSKA